MRKTYHLCISSHDEVMYRCDEDFIFGFNCLANAALETESRLLSDGFMTTHRHTAVQTDSTKELSFKERNIYSRYFNSKYHRRGGLGEKTPFVLEVDGLRHIQTMLSYVNRQGLHHGLCSTPFGYRHCSANAFFRPELGKPAVVEVLLDEKRHRYLSKGFEARYLKNIRMSKDGLLLREDVIDTDYVEEVYISARSFVFHMNRLSGEEWAKEQAEDKEGGVPITLDILEPDKGAVAQMLLNENGRVNKSLITDIELCRVIDRQIVPALITGIDNPSIYDLGLQQRKDIGNEIWTGIKNGSFCNNYGIAGTYTTKEQLIRCLALNKE